MVFYAQLNNENIVIGISQLNEEINISNMVLIDSFDDTLLGKRYNAETGEFEEVTQTELTELIELPTIEEQIYAENLYQTALLEIQMLGGIE